MGFRLVCLLATGLAVAACGGGGSGTDLGGPTASDPSDEVTSDELCTQVGALIDCAFEHDGLDRTFKIYEPLSYDGSSPTPVLLNFHGYGGTADEQLLYGDFRDLADQDNFILVVPQGALLEGSTHWNSDSDINSKSTVDDLGFISRTIDAVSDRYNVDTARMYAVGMSNGGAMSLYLACGLGERITAVASVTGFMSAELLAECGATDPTSVLLIHGTEDSVIPWIGADGDAILDIGVYSAGHNGCTESTQLAFEDYNEDGVSGVLHQYAGCDDGTQVQVYEMTGMGHIWPERQRGDDINGAEVAWAFLNTFSR